VSTAYCAARCHFGQPGSRALHWRSRCSPSSAAAAAGRARRALAISIGTGLCWCDGRGSLDHSRSTPRGWVPVWRHRGGRATIGGAAAGFRAPRVVAAVCWAAIRCPRRFVLNVLQSPCSTSRLGSTSASQTTAASCSPSPSPCSAGLTAGLVRSSCSAAARRTGEQDPLAPSSRWPAGPGLLLVADRGWPARPALAARPGRPGDELETTVQQMLSAPASTTR